MSASQLKTFITLSNFRKEIWLCVLYLISGSSFSLAANECKRLIYSGSDDWYPVSYMDNEKQLAGRALERIKEIASKLNYELVVLENLPWKRQLKLLEDGKLTLIAAYFNNDRAARFNYSSAFHKERVKIFVRKNDRRKITSLKGLNNLIGARPRAASLGDEFDQYSHNNENIFQIDVTQNMFRMLVNERVDFVVTAFSNGNRAVEDLGLQERIVTLDYQIAEKNVHFMISRHLSCNIDLRKINALLEQNQVAPTRDK